MERIFDTYSSADAANEVCGRLEFIGHNVFVRQIACDVYQVVIQD